MKEEKKMLTRNQAQFHRYIKDLVIDDKVLQMDGYIQHGDITTLEHVIAVSYISFILAKKWNADVKTAVRAAMLHDLYLYDWHIRDPERPPFTHAFMHPAKAAENARKYFDPSEKELEIIRTHMWPLTITRFPTSKEAFILTLADKYCAWNESFGIYEQSALRKKIKNYLIFIKKQKALNNLKKRQQKQ